MTEYTPGANCRTAEKRQKFFICSCVEIFTGKKAKSGPLANKNEAGILIMSHRTFMARINDLHRQLVQGSRTS